MNPAAYQLATAAALRADGDDATAAALMALSPDEVAAILLASEPPADTFAEWTPYRGPEGGMGWTNGTEVRYQREKPDDDDGTGGGTDPHRQDIKPGIDQAARVLGGATVGGMTGAAIAGPLGAVVGGGIGAAVGSDLGRAALGGVRRLLNLGEEPEGIARRVTAGDPDAVAAVREDATSQARDAATKLVNEPPGDPAEVRRGWAQASAKMRAGDAAELGGHVEALATAREPDKVDSAFRAMGGFLGRLTGGALRLALGAIKAFGRFAMTTGKPYLVWAASLATGAAVLAAPPVALGLGLISPLTAFALAPVAVGGAIGAGMVGRSKQRTAGGPAATFAEGPADFTPAGPDGKRAVELLSASQAAGVNTLTEVADRAVRRLLMLPNPGNAAHLFEDDELHRIAGALAGGIATADLLGRSRVRRRAEMAERRVAAFADDPGPPGAPPRPGLTWKRETQRWVRKGADHAKELTRRAKEAPAKLKGTVKSYVEKKYAKLEARYGAKGAKAIMAASLLLLPVPVPGASFVPIALAEAVRAIGKGAAAVGFADTPVSDEIVQAVVEFLTDLYAATGEAAPAIDPAKVRAALERDEVDEDDVETFAEWTRYEGPEGGRGWKNTAGEVRYQEEMPGAGAGPPPAPAGKKPEGGRVEQHGRSTTAVVGEMFGGSPDPADLALAACGLSGSTVSLSGSGSGSRAVLTAEVEGPGYTAVREFERGADGKLEVTNSSVRIAPGATVSGADLFTAQVGALRRLGVARIKTLAARRDHDNPAMRQVGHYVWPRFGYDGSLKPEQYDALPPNLKAQVDANPAGSNFPKSIQSLYATPEGREWWKANGSTIGLTFDLSDGSRSLAVLTAYLREKGRPAAMSEWRPSPTVAGDDIALTADEEAAMERAWAALSGARTSAFAESPPDDPWHDFAEPVPAVEPAAAVDYFRRLVPTLADDPGRYGPMLARHAFTLAVATEQTLLHKVKDAILSGLRTGVDATADVQDVLDAAGVSPKNPQYAEMVTRTATMDALNAGAVAEMQTPEMQEAFPVWRYDGILDSRTGDDHRPLIGRHFHATANFADVRGPRIFNCRCSPTPVWKGEAAALIRAGKVERG